MTSPNSTIQSFNVSCHVNHNGNIIDNAHNVIPDTTNDTFLELQSELEVFQNRLNTLLGNPQIDSKALNCLKVELEIFQNKCLDADINETNEIYTSIFELLKTVDSQYLDDENPHDDFILENTPSLAYSITEERLVEIDKQYQTIKFNYLKNQLTSSHLDALNDLKSQIAILYSRDILTDEEKKELVFKANSLTNNIEGLEAIIKSDFSRKDATYLNAFDEIYSPLKLQYESIREDWERGNYDMENLESLLIAANNAAENFLSTMKIMNIEEKDNIKLLLTLIEDINKLAGKELKIEVKINTTFPSLEIAFESIKKQITMLYSLFTQYV